MAAPTIDLAPRVCPDCGDPYLGVRCTFRMLPNGCEDIGGPHVDWGCTSCASHSVEATSGRCCARRR